MIDFHTHILPAVDDGVSSTERMLEVLETAVQEGVSTVLFTPHVLEPANDSQTEKIKTAFVNALENVSDRNIPIEVILGAEVFISPDLPQLAEQKKELTIAGRGKFILVELPFMEPPSYLEATLMQLLEANITPILAHPERYRYFQKEKTLFKRLLDQGILVQCNFNSLAGRYGIGPKKAVRDLIKNQAAHLFATDFHGRSIEPYRFKWGVDMLTKKMSPERVSFIVEKLPRQIIQGQDFTLPLPGFNTEFERHADRFSFRNLLSRLFDL